MTEMICECGHPASEHSDINGCLVGWDGDSDGCKCGYTPDLFSARQWARFWYKRALDAERLASEQSEFIQREGLSPYEKYGMEGKIEMLEAENDKLRKIVGDSQSETMVENVFLIMAENAELRQKIAILEAILKGNDIAKPYEWGKPEKTKAYVYTGPIPIVRIEDGDLT